MVTHLVGAQWVRDINQVTARASAGRVGREWAREPDRRDPHDQTSKAIARSKQPARSDDVWVSRVSFVKALTPTARLRPLMCGRPAAFGEADHLRLGLCPICSGAARIYYKESDGRAERFRTSGGIAESPADHLLKV